MDMSALQRYLSVCELALFFALVVGRVLMLRRRGVRAFVFGETSRSDYLLVPMFPLLAYTVLAGAFGLPMPRALIQPFWNSVLTGWAGLLLCAAALIGLYLTLRAFGDSFRVGIDEKKPDKLVTTGMFALSRNPVYVCFLLFFLGMLLLYPNIVIAAVLVLFALAIHRQVLREEAFLRSHYGGEYGEYCKKVRRYL